MTQRKIKPCQPTGNISQLIGRFRPPPGCNLSGGYMDLDEIRNLEVEVIDVKQKRKIGIYNLIDLNRKLR